jgi:hypothetical protein
MQPKNLITATAALCAVMLAGCAQQPRHDAAHCQLSGTNNVERLFEEASEKLRDSACHYSYPEYRQQLVAAAKGSPGPENEARFAELVRESIDLGVISKRQGQELFSQYFDPEFYAVKDEARSSCTSLRQREELNTLMRRELEYKREGMLEILDDEQRFRQAQHYYNDLHVIFDAVEAACLQDV